MYPAIDESDLYLACDRVHNNAEPSNYDIFCVHITLAISTNTLMQYDEKRATSATRGLWATARGHLDQIGSENLQERLQALQLLTHYACFNPQDANCVNCGAAATRLCLQLGLHHELSDTTRTRLKLDSTTINHRRRLFWNAYCLEVAIHTVLCRPFIWPKDAFTAKFPDFDTESCPIPHVWRLRYMEAEIFSAMYHPHLARNDQLWKDTFDEWFIGIQNRVDEWLLTTRKSCLTLRLNRPSPRYPTPTRRMQRKTLQSSIALIREFNTIDRMGKLFIIWHAAFFIVESGVCLMASILTELESECTHRGSSYLGNQDVAILICCMKTFPSLLRKLSRRRKQVTPHASALEAVSYLVLEKLEQWSSGDIVWGTDFETLRRDRDNAAPSAHDAGARVALLEAAPKELRGGNSRFASACFRVARNGMGDIEPLIHPDNKYLVKRARLAPFTKERYAQEFAETSKDHFDAAAIEVMFAHSLDTVR
ncbi:uncharacterized protein Z518_00112 [Rhinocladiella mackenziei CBS 650.93]|uniref:Xylanolytic transcriptional activator regulatory domain-containing protein n=1 Tax=Rhinocladiella mackenziei CBS 650.93 TaxID=1442369 RepID=A0A0D2ISU6_9EURO|nr:uncharacterized protein Z518_00112 [Rhinocladiella mackenziei CBS 650.93]KIX09034.1 hypothetical protein Z518_00112 [Rhinocladiella mackenziei CBS 650.93]